MLARSVDRKTGRARWLMTKATTVRDVGGDLLAVNVIEDVTPAKEAEHRQRLLADAGRILGGSLDQRETMDRVAHLAVPELADWCTVDVVLPDGKVRRTAIVHADPAKMALGWELAERFALALDRPTGVGAVLRTGEPELYPELSEELLAAAFPDPEQLEATLALGMRSAMLVPMRAGDRTLGVMTFASAESRRVFDETTLALAMDIAQRAAAAIENARLYEDLQATFQQTITSLARTIDKMDRYTSGHSERVARYAVNLARWMGLDAVQIEHVRHSALMHDIGKIGCVMNLNKTGKLTQPEYEVFKRHPTYGREILDPIKFLQPVIPGVYLHHERWDGRGYPLGMAGNDIPLIARIIAVADTYDAMTSDRAYRRALPHEVTVNEILRCSGSQFDPDIANIFTEQIDGMRAELIDSGATIPE